MENENKTEETRPDTVRKRLRGIFRFVFLFLLVVSLVWGGLTIAVWISFGPTTSEDDELKGIASAINNFLDEDFKNESVESAEMISELIGEFALMGCRIHN